MEKQLKDITMHFIHSPLHMSAFSFFLLLSVIRCLFVSAALPLSPTHFVSSLTCPDARVHDVNGNDTVSVCFCPRACVCVSVKWQSYFYGFYDMSERA